MKKLFVLLLLALSVTAAEAQRVLVPGVSVNSFTASALTNTAGTPYAVPDGFSPTISWTTTLATTPSAISVSLQGSQDNLSWFTLDTTTNTAGDLRYLNPIALNYVRAFITSRTGGSTVTVSIIINRGFNNVMSGGTLTTGAIVPALCTSGNGFAFAGDLDTKICSDTANNIKFYANGVNSVTIDESGLNVAVGDFILEANDTISWTGRSKISSPADGRLLFTDQAGTDWGRLQFGGTTSSYPALKRSSTTLAVRLADDSADAPLTASTIITSGAITGTSLIAGAGNSIQWTGRSRVHSPADGRIVLANATLTDFSRLMFGGETAAFPSIKRSGAQLHARVADDSDYAVFAAASYSISGAVTLSTPGLGVLTLGDGGGSFNRIQLGGTSSSFPSIKRSSANIEFKAADDSAYTAIYASSVNFGATGGIVGDADGVFRLRDNAGTSFSRLTFGGTTSSFPAIKRNSAAIDFRLADDSAYAAIVAAGMTAQSGVAGQGLIVGADSNAITLNNSTTKIGRVGVPHYLSSTEEPMALITGSSTFTNNTVNIGGSSSGLNAATSIFFYTAANNTTVAGTARWNITSSGNFEPGADNTYDIGGSSLDIRSVYAESYRVNGKLTISSTAPTIASGGCTSPAVTWNNGTALFLITIGTSCAGVQTFTLTMPAATNRWGCDGENNTSDAAQMTNYIVARATSTTAVVITSYDRTTNVKEDFTASDTYLIKCTAG